MGYQKHLYLHHWFHGWLPLYVLIWSPDNTLLEGVLFGLQLVDLSLLLSYLQTAQVEVVVNFMLKSFDLICDLRELSRNISRRLRSFTACRCWLLLLLLLLLLLRHLLLWLVHLCRSLCSSWLSRTATKRKWALRRMRVWLLLLLWCKWWLSNLLLLFLVVSLLWGITSKAKAACRWVATSKTKTTVRWILPSPSWWRSLLRLSFLFRLFLPWLHLLLHCGLLLLHCFLCMCLLF